MGSGEGMRIGSRDVLGIVVLAKNHGESWYGFGAKVGDLQEESLHNMRLIWSFSTALPVPKQQTTLSKRNTKREAIKSRFGGNEESKKMQKNVLKHQFENFTTTLNKSLDKAYDRFQKLISQLEVHGAPISKEDINQKFLRSLHPSWNQIALIMRNKPNIDDLYNNLRVYEDEIKRSSSSTSTSQNLAFISSENTSRHAPTNESSSQALVAQDGLGGYDWRIILKIEPVNYALDVILFQAHQVLLTIRMKHQMTEDGQVLHDELEKMIAQEVVAKALDDATRQAFEEEKRNIASQKRAAQATSINKLSTGRSSISTATTPYVSAASTPTGANAGESSFIYFRGKIPIDASTLPNADLPINLNMPDLEDDSDAFSNAGIFNGAYDDENVEAVADSTI
ncbi:hypothetical protein Tco_0563297 [Tanacetum coccineum]